MTFNPASTFCAENFFESRSSPSTLLIEENTISAIHLLPVSFSCFHPSYPSFLRRKTSSLLNGHPLDVVDAFFLILIAGSAFMSSSIEVLSVVICFVSIHLIYYTMSLSRFLYQRTKLCCIMYVSFRYSE